ncbi:MAG: hypothetical protein COB14_09790 [Alphaproteobacteria bacterium]|nr:MAG: hypothetical protein COB14_09790 [Alphaproteobacteria bacterium]
MSDLKTIRKMASDCSGGIVTVKKLEESGGSKTVKHAKAVGVYVARKSGCEYGDIAKTFGYANEKSVSRVFTKVSKDILYDSTLQRDVNAVAEKLGIDLD